MKKIFLLSCALASSQIFASNLCEKLENISFNDCILTSYEHGPANQGTSFKVKFDGKIESVFKDGQNVIEYSKNSDETGNYTSTLNFGVQTPYISSMNHIPNTNVTFERSAECKSKNLVLNTLETAIYIERQSKHISKNRTIVKVLKNTIVFEDYVVGSIQKTPNGKPLEMDPYQGNPSQKLICKIAK